MQVIPVIDLLNGEVVHAKKGQRQHYQSLQSELCPSSDPLAIVAALLAVHPFKQLYIADLNAIQKLPHKTTTNFAVIARIINAYPQLEIWLDAGITQAADMQLWQPLNLNLILASESVSTMEGYLQLSQQLGNFILSLDFFSDGFHGPQALLNQTEHWPQRVIIMSLADVGANQGVNRIRLEQLVQQNNTSRLYAAGGVRNAADIRLLKELGLHGALIATALHTQQITGADLQQDCQ